MRICQTWAIPLVPDKRKLHVQGGRRSDDEDMDVEQIDIRALERVSPRTSLMAPEQVLLRQRACLNPPVNVRMLLVRPQAKIHHLKVEHALRRHTVPLRRS